jgi:autotransporter-associated beta strand protein
MRPTHRQKRRANFTGLGHKFVADWYSNLRRPSLVAIIVSTILVVGVFVVKAVNTTNNYTGGSGGSLLTASNWSLGHIPTVSEDAVFTATTGIRTLTAGSLTVGSFNVTAASGTFSIRNDTSIATNSTLTLGGAGSTGNGVSGTASDLLYNASGSTFNIIGPNGSTGTGVLNLVLGQSGNFDAAGTMSVSSVISDGGSGFGITKIGAGALTLSGANTYTGGVTINAGTLRAGSTTALGPAANASLTFGASSTGRFQLNGNNTTVIDLNTNATVGSPIIESSSGTAGIDTLTVNTANTDSFAGVLQNGSARLLALSKSGAGTLTLSGANNYTGGTTVTVGTLTLGASGVLADTGAMILNGGTFKAGATTGFTETAGTLALTDSSAIALGTGSHTLTFADSSGVTWTASKTITITGWAGGYNGTSGTAGKIFVGGSPGNGLTASQLSQIVFFNGSLLYPATMLSTGEVVPLASPTAVRLMNFTAAKNGNDVLLQWQSGFEAHNLGYYVYREQNGTRTRITPSIVAGSALMVGRQTILTAGYSYTWWDQISEVGDQKSEVGSQTAGADDVTYWLEDVDLDGTRTLHGPITPLIARSSLKQEAAARAPLLNELQLRAASTGILLNGWPAAESRSQKSEGRGQKSEMSTQGSIAVQQDVAETPGVKLAVSKAGWYRVTQPELVAAGFDTNCNAPQIQLVANGQEVPIKVSGNGTQLTSSDYIEFYGHGVNSTTDVAQTYYLLAGNSAGQRITLVNNGPVPPPSRPQNYNYTIERKDRTIYYAAFLNGDAENIFGQVVTSTPGSATLPVSHRDIAAGGQVQLEISLVGVSFEDHHVHVTLNGTDVGTIDFGMIGQPHQTFTVPASLLHDGDNIVQLTSLGGNSDVSLADTLRLTYPRSYTADNDTLSISISSGATTRVNGFSNANVRVVDITDPNNIQELTPIVAVQPDSAYAADVQIAAASAAQPHTLLVFPDSQAGHPDSVKQNQPSAWKANANGADYLIITSRDFISNAQTLAQYRQNHGLAAKVIDVEDLYDEFSFGLHSPQAIRDFLQTAASTWTLKPRYVLLMGDASFDPKNYLGQGNTDFVPTKLFDTTLMETASDDWLADFNNDGLADLAIGRLPVRTSGDATLMVNKIIAFEAMPFDPERGALLVADRGFEASSNAVEGVLPPSMPKQLINRSSNTDSAIHAQILNGINQGPQVVNYLGHGSNGVWTGGRLLSNPDAPLMTNTNGLSLFVMMTCLNGYFEDAYNDSLAEGLLRTPGGAVAVWASTGMTEPSGQNLVDLELYRQLFNGQSPRLGDAVRAAKATTGDSDIRRTWTLFADPAMQLKTAAPTATNGSVGGVITDGQGGRLAGTTISLGGSQTRQTITDSNGAYSFTNLDANGAYTITPTRPNYAFTPASRSFSLLGLHTDASFVATAQATPINPLDTTDYFVRQQYLDFLGREPDESGFNFWSNQIRSCVNDATCLEVRRINTSAAFFLSIEFQQTGYLVYRTYKSAYGNMPNAPVPVRLEEFLPDTKEIGQGVVVNKTGWETVLENNKQAFMSEFVQRSRFASAHPVTMTPVEFVDRLFANAGVTPAGSVRADAISEFGSAANTGDLAARARALRRVGENRMLAEQESNRAFVLMQYFGYLRRNPNDAPEATQDYRGYNFWLDKLNAFNGNFANAEMVKAFLLSGEYRQRFGQ